MKQFNAAPKKNPARVAAGKLAHARLRAELGEAGYIARQRRAAKAKTTEQQRRAALASNEAQLEKYGPDGYRRQRQDAYQALVQKIGPEAARARLTKAHAERRQFRLDHPTPGEALIVALLQQRGYTVQAAPTSFEFAAWDCDPDGAEYGQREAIREAQIDVYFADVLIPSQRLVIEINGGIHVLHSERDARRCATLREYGLTVYTITEEDATNEATAQAILNHILA